MTWSVNLRNRPLTPRDDHAPGGTPPSSRAVVDPTDEDTAGKLAIWLPETFFKHEA